MAQSTQLGHVEPVGLPNHTFPGKALYTKRLTSICIHSFISGREIILRDSTLRSCTICIKMSYSPCI